MTLLNKKDGVSQSFKTIPENRLRTYILLGTHANSCRKLANNQPIPIFYKGVVYRAQVSGAICPPSIPEMTLMIADADYQPPISLADILKEIAKSDECFMSDKCLVDGVCDCETNDYNSNDDKE